MLDQIAHSIGKRTRLKRLLYGHGLNGKLLLLPIDQGLEHGPRDFFDNPDSIDPEFQLKLAVKGGFSGIVFHIGLAEKYMKEYADKTYGINPYLVAVSQGADQAEPLIKKGADAVTSYALLPDFSAKATPIQDYAMMVDRSEGEWQNMHTRLDVPYVPTVVVGWDATARTSNDIAFENGVGMYPFTPIIHGGTRALFGEMLRRQYAYLKANVPVSEQYIPVNAWNEITEGSSLLPRIRSDGTVDSGLLEEIKAFSEDIVKNNIA